MGTAMAFTSMVMGTAMAMADRTVARTDHRSGSDGYQRSARGACIAEDRGLNKAGSYTICGLAV
jgi:hypothetical protein